MTFNEGTVRGDRFLLPESVRRMITSHPTGAHPPFPADLPPVYEEVDLDGV